MLGHVKNNNIQLNYQTFGHHKDETIVLIAGLGSQMIHWNVAFCLQLAKQGFHVIRFDHRDVGLSTHLDHLAAPSFSDLVDAMTFGKNITIPYTLDDMVEDTIGLLDALEINQAHIIGRSMGGMIAQLLASQYPQRVSSLTSIMSSTGNPNLPAAKADVMQLLTQATPNPQADFDQYLADKIKLAQRIASPAYPFDQEAMTALFVEEYHRGYNPNGFKRHLTAIAAAGDLRARIANITVPTLVIHGTDDVLIPIECGEDTAKTIASARFLAIEGMGHDIPSALYPQIIAAFGQNLIKHV